MVLIRNNLLSANIQIPGSGFTVGEIRGIFRPGSRRKVALLRILCAPEGGNHDHRRSVEDRLDVEDEYYMSKCLAIRNLKKPTIAAIKGNVVLGGIMLACMCDIIIAAENTRLWNPSIRHCGSGGEVMVLPFEIGFRKTKEYLWTGDIIPLHEAERLGMINRIVPDERLDAEALKMAERIALMPPVSLAMTKRAMNKAQDFMGMAMAFEYQYIWHQMTHATKESDDWNAEASKHSKEKGFRGWLEFRDGPFNEQAKKKYE